MFKALSRSGAQLGRPSEPGGGIDDDVVGPTTTYSSQKLEAMLAQKNELELMAGLASGRLFVNDLTIGD